MKTTWWAAFLAVIGASFVMAHAWAHGNNWAGLGAVGAFLVAGCLVFDRYMREGEL